MEDAKLADQAATGLRLTAQDLFAEDLIDKIIKKPPGVRTTTMIRRNVISMWL